MLKTLSLSKATPKYRGKLCNVMRVAKSAFEIALVMLQVACGDDKAGRKKNRLNFQSQLAGETWSPLEPVHM